MNLVNKLHELINNIDNSLAILDEILMQEQPELLESAFDHLERILDDLCEVQVAYEEDDK